MRVCVCVCVCVCMCVCVCVCVCARMYVSIALLMLYIHCIHAHAQYRKCYIKEDSVLLEELGTIGAVSYVMYTVKDKLKLSVKVQRAPLSQPIPPA